MKIKIGVSNRHIHLTEEMFNVLFEGKELEVVKKLSQSDDFASNLFVTIKTSKSEIEKVRLVGPLRKYNQVEISKTDAYKLGINPPVRMSGDLEGSETVTVCSDTAEIELTNSCIIAARHIHATLEDYQKYNLKEVMSAIIETEKGGVMSNILVKTDPTYVLELHIDTDDANAFLLKQGDEIEIREDL